MKVKLGVGSCVVVGGMTDVVSWWEKDAETSPVGESERVIDMVPVIVGDLVAESEIDFDRDEDKEKDRDVEMEMDVVKEAVGSMDGVRLSLSDGESESDCVSDNDAVRVSVIDGDIVGDCEIVRESETVEV